MSQEDMSLFIEELRNDKTLAEAFAKAVADTARQNGHKVEAKDVLEHFLGDTPRRRPLPEDADEGPRMTTMAMGEEEPRASVTLAIGEEDRPRGMTGGIGEERKPRTPPTRGVTTLAIGEEGTRPRR